MRMRNFRKVLIHSAAGIYPPHFLLIA